MSSDEKTKRALLIIEILPLLASTPNFSLKGGTGINYFALDFPRLSTDIDLAFIHILPRDQSIAAI
ncbi:hypothetical protein MNBD_GAMMA12-2834 [hydrothermal vent metagenome]|uniref:Ync n=1 Tax=hydrothermal vent metagenome TaxID=652676 RepID=A0A3B0YH07_9ZZZZ